MRAVSRTTVILASGAVLSAAGGITALSLAGQHGRPPAHPAFTHVTAARPPLRIVSVTPSNGSRNVNGTDPVTVTFNQPLAAGQPFPRLSPAVPGTWTRSGAAAIFTPASGFPGGATVRVSAPGTAARARSGPGMGFTTAPYSNLRMQEMLAQMGYLPMTWSAYLGGTVTPGSLAAQATAAYNAPSGSFSWKSGYADDLRGLWQQGQQNTLESGAITAFEADHGMQPGAVSGAALWASVMQAAAAGQRNHHGYYYAVVSKSRPETLTIYHNGRRIFSSLANTGIASRPTATGTYYVYEKLTFQIMEGTNPDGSHYADPVRWVSYFNGGEAVHYFPRSSFGYPQSLGCVELPYSDAERSYRLLPYGTVVSVRW